MLTLARFAFLFANVGRVCLKVPVSCFIGGGRVAVFVYDKEAYGNQKYI